MEKQPKNEDDVTTIQLLVRTRNKLKRRGKKGDTYDKVIEELLLLAEKDKNPT